MDWIVQPMSRFNEVAIIISSDCPSAFSTTSCAWYSECNGTGRLIIVQN
jgi:hypothetical protein